MVEITLVKPITVGEKVLDKLSLDFDALTFNDYTRSKVIAKLLTPKGYEGDDLDTLIDSKSSEVMRIGVSWVAAMYGTPGLTLHDVSKLSLQDTLTLGEVAVVSYFFRL